MDEHRPFSRNLGNKNLGKFVLIQSKAEPNGGILASESAARRRDAFGENQPVDLPLYNGRLKVEDVLVCAAAAPEKPAG